MNLREKLIWIHKMILPFLQKKIFAVFLTSKQNKNRCESMRSFLSRNNETADRTPNAGQTKYWTKLLYQ